MCTTRTALEFCYDRIGGRRRILLESNGRELRIWFDSLNELGTFLAQSDVDWQRSARILAQVRRCMAEDAQRDADFPNPSRRDLPFDNKVMERDGSPGEGFWSRINWIGCGFILIAVFAIYRFVEALKALGSWL